eukprot:TRINITY_DN2559_c0_g2_i1.p1 TRINITY_DN2559_c0_g2~~TRINITY_DN2559_c0_g2_i1.p1  ORF type:complete len:199 (+),score=32.47 TRINITY_DN2559_c0_g2_i1:75-671(+)
MARMMNTSGAIMTTDRSKVRQLALQIGRSTSVPELAAQEDMLRRQIANSTAQMRNAVGRSVREDRQRSRAAAAQSAEDDFRRPSATTMGRSRSMSKASASQPLVAADSHAPLVGGVRELDELDKLLECLLKRKSYLQDYSRIRNNNMPLEAIGCAKARSVKDHAKWFASYGHPTPGMAFKDWQPNAPHIWRGIKYGDF